VFILSFRLSVISGVRRSFHKKAGNHFKRGFFFIDAFCSLLCCTVASCARRYPLHGFRAVYPFAIAEKMMKTSMGAITSAGLRILGVTFSVSLILAFFTLAVG
jgi:hypothetical protein